ncbi:MAG: 30S ribosomal protein S20 [Candidatus Paceibacteria bacterium]
MAITKGAKKATRSSERKRVFNLRTKRAMASAVKAATLTKGKDRKEQDAALSAAYKAIDKAAKRGTIKRNTAARKKSRLSARLKKASAK